MGITGPYLLVLESLEMNDQNLRKRPNVEFLECLTEVLAVRAVPHVILAQLLFSVELLQAVLQVHPPGLLEGSLAPLSLFNTRASLHCHPLRQHVKDISQRQHLQRCGTNQSISHEPPGPNLPPTHNPS